MLEKVKSFFVFVGVFFSGIVCGLLYHRRTTSQPGADDIGSTVKDGRIADRKRELESGFADAEIRNGRITDGLGEIGNGLAEAENIIGEIRKQKL